MRMSISTTSGRSALRQRHRLRRRRAASPTTSISPVASSTARKPARISGWSSAISEPQRRLTAAAPRAPRSRAVAAAAGLERAAEQRDPLAHADGARARAGRAPALGAGAVVEDRQLELVGAVAQAHLGAQRPRVLDHVGQRLLDDPVGREVDAGRQRPRLRPRPRARPRARRRARARSARGRRGRREPARARVPRHPAGAARRASVHLGQRLAADRRRSARRRASRSAPSSAPSAWACTTIRLTPCATTSCSSRAIRTRSSATACSVSSACSRSSCAARSCSDSRCARRAAGTCRRRPRARWRPGARRAQPSVSGAVPCERRPHRGTPAAASAAAATICDEPAPARRRWHGREQHRQRERGAARPDERDRGGRRAARANG